MDECDLSQKELEKRKKVIAETLGIAVENILICENYQPNQKLDSRDYEIFEFLTKVHKYIISLIFKHVDHFKFQFFLLA